MTCELDQLHELYEFFSYHCLTSFYLKTVLQINALIGLETGLKSIKRFSQSDFPTLL